MKAIRKCADGKYHIHGKVHDILVGSRAQVMHGTAYKTTGGLTKSHLMMNKHGRIVSRKKHTTAKKEKRLEKAGYKTKKGVFGAIKNGNKNNKTRKNKNKNKSKKNNKK